MVNHLANDNDGRSTETLFLSGISQIFERCNQMLLAIDAALLNDRRWRGSEQSTGLQLLTDPGQVVETHVDHKAITAGSHADATRYKRTLRS